MFFPFAVHELAVVNGSLSRLTAAFQRAGRRSSPGVRINQVLEKKMNGSKNRFRVTIAAIAFGLAALIALPGMANAHGNADKSQNQKRSVSKSKKVSIGFAALNGAKPVTCGRQITDLGNTSRSAQLSDLRFYVSEVQLLKKGGGAVNVKLPTGSKWSYTKGKAAVTLIDLENGTGSCVAEGTKGMNAKVQGTVPKGSYMGVRYSVSVPESLNHTDPTTVPSPLNLTAMGWNWQFGHKFMKVELEQDGGIPWGSEIYYLHVGSTDCVGDPAAGDKAECGLPNRNKVTLGKFNPAKQRIAIDFQRLFGGVNVAGDNMGGMEGMEMAMGGCMSAIDSPDCGPLFSALGMKLGTTKTTAQTAFRVVRK